MMPMKDDGNWLGFSLSPRLKMEAAANDDDDTNNNNNTPMNPFGLHFGHHQNVVVSQNDDFTPVVMPLKSDTSLCLMEALSTSHSQVPSPKLENFLGGTATTTMAAHSHHHHHHHNQRDPHPPMFLSLDYNNNNNNNINNNYGYNYNYYGLNYGQILHDFPCPKPWMIEPDHDFDPQFASPAAVVQNKAQNEAGQGPLSSLSLSMSPGSQSSCVTNNKPTNAGECSTLVVRSGGSKKRGLLGQRQTVHRKSIDTFGQRTSQYRGVTRHRWTGRYEAHLWDNSSKKEGQTRKGRQGGYDMEDKAARAYDLAALKYWGPSTHINFPLENYQQELEEMKSMNRQEYVAHLRRRSSGFSRGASMYRGVTRHHQHGRWQARIGRVAGNKDLYLGTFSTQEEAAEAYDIAAIKFRGPNAVTNFNMSRYDVDKIMTSNALPAGEMARRKDESELTIATSENVESSPPKTVTDDYQRQMARHLSDPSSLVTSLSSSREASPDHNFLLGKPASSDNLTVFASWSDVALV
ncbi:AP2-like ethylene-responsive transcription factor ANT [Striga hermonthica]|uniref:AP2-like ethylene-responsive transcription factor ANT n=1 Tax=Striga hermonthica TaxID=68872 RepID=A0A9N7MNW6_STRHE|nr:AP2-like ethylene-responsive transcription factor ANT [Striga hermonthica]